MDLSLYKMHGSKNTFYLIETNDIHQIPYVELTKWLCSQKGDDGADGLLVVLPSAIANAKMRIFNADGSEASMCGNGLRCVARYILERDHLDEALIETMKATLSVSKAEEMMEGVPTFSVEIGPVSFDLNTLPFVYNNKTRIEHEIIPSFSHTIYFTALSLPNAHLVGVVDLHYIQYPKHQLLLAEFLNNSPLTPDGINVSYMYPISESEIFVRTFERGVGFTNACGTAMTASALVAYSDGYVKSPVITVYNPGGFVKCTVNLERADTQLRLAGNATYVQKLSVSYKSENFFISSCKVYDESILYDERIKGHLEIIRKLGLL